MFVLAPSMLLVVPSCKYRKYSLRLLQIEFPQKFTLQATEGEGETLVLTMASDADAKAKGGGERQQTTADLDRVTDYVEDQELDAEKFSRSVAMLGSNREKKKGGAELDKELLALKVPAEDVQLVANQMDIDEKTAELAIKEHRGDVAAALNALIRR